jgi:hypothetical protein
MATGMSRGSLDRAMEQFQAVDPGSRMRLQLHTAAPPVTLPAFKWAGFGSVRVGRSGKLAAYPSRVEHARAHRLAAERARRNRRCARKGRPDPGGLHSARPVTWTMSIDTRGFTAAFAQAGQAVRRLTEGLTSSVRTQLEDGSLNRLLRLYAGSVADETSGPDTDYCASTGGSWSDLMARIDELTDDAS